MKGPTATDVATWISDLESDLAQIDAALLPLVERQTALVERLGLLKRLLGSMTAVHAAPATKESTVDGGLPPARIYGSVRERVQDHVAEILVGVGRPLHINEIHTEFIKRGFEVPGAGKPNNITVHLSDATEILSPSRGYYAIKNAGQPDSTVRYPVADESRGRRAHG